MTVDVTTETVIERPCDVVASYAIDPDNAPVWYVNIKTVEWKTPRPVRVGSSIVFVAHFLGHQLVYTYDVVELVPARRMVMRAADGPFPMETTYEFEALARGTTSMRLRNRGALTGFARLVSPIVAVAMRHANRKDLARLKKRLEQLA